MPLDNLDLHDAVALPLSPKLLTLHQRLAALGITPVDPTIVSQHKMAWSNCYRHVPTACWIRLPLPASRLRKALDNSRQSAPEAIVKLAERVHQEIPNASYTMDYFYLDPILNVHLNDQEACLGIWEARKVVRIAATSKQGFGLLNTLRAMLRF